MFGQHLPGMLAHRGFGVDLIVSILAFGTESIHGTPTCKASTYIFLFILFCAFWAPTGMISLFNDSATGMGDRMRGGPDKVACIS